MSDFKAFEITPDALTAGGEQTADFLTADFLAPDFLAPDFLAGGGEMGRLIAGHDWSATPFDALEAWPTALKTALSICLCHPAVSAICWGPEHRLLYNDAYKATLAERHPFALGRPYGEVWAEVADVVVPQLVGVLETGQGFVTGNQQLGLQWLGRTRTTFWIYSFTPIRDGDRVHGVFVAATDMTAQILDERRSKLLLELEHNLRRLSDPEHILSAAAESLGRQLGAGEVAYAEIDETTQYARIRLQWGDGSIPTNAGTHKLDSFGASMAADLRAGRTVVVEDVRLDPRTSTPEALAGYDAVAVGSFLNLPVMKTGRLSGIFLVHSRLARCWAEDEVLLAQDVAERTWTTLLRARAEADLRELNETLEKRVAERTLERDRTWRNSQDILVVVDRNGVFDAVSPVLTKVLGWTPGEVVGRAICDFAHPHDRRTIETALEHASQATLPALENRFRHKDGGYRWLSWVAAVENERIYATARNITAEKAAKEAHERSEARLRTLFETSAQLQSLLTLDGDVLEANTVALQAIDAEMSEVAGRAFWDTPWFTDTPELMQQVRASVLAAAAGQTSRQEVALRLPSGVRSYDLTIRPVRNEQGDVVAIAPEAVDITERRLAEEALRQSQKMEAVGQLTGGIAHDFNNLLTGITGSLELLRARVNEGRIGSIDRYILAAEGAAKRAAALTHRLLAFSRRQTLDPKPTNVNRLIGDMEELIRRSVGPNVALEVIGAGGLWPTLVDSNQLENALLNLCINARDAMSHGGRIVIETANKWLDDRAARDRDVSPGQYLSLCVTDTGTGMTPEVVARAFDPFFTTKPIGSGTGLGLSMIYGFARQSGGQVRIYSELGQGTTMCLYLPRYMGEAEDVDAVVISRPRPHAPSGKTVLVIDDEPAVRMLVAEVLEECGCIALEAADGPSGLKMLQSNPVVELLITDVGLPGGLSGRQVADAALAARPDLKVLFITGYAENAVLADGRLDPRTALLTKPFTMEALARKIREMTAVQAAAP